MSEKPKSRRFSPAAWLEKLTRRLRFPQLFLLTAAVFLIDLAIPDVMPFADEILLGLITALLGGWRKKAPVPSEAEKNRLP